MIEKEVVSSQIKKVAYDEENKELFVTFNTGSKYKYSNVTKELFLQLIRAESIGAFFGKKIKGNANYPFVLVSK